jgi:hypothetical protein
LDGGAENLGGIFGTQVGARRGSGKGTQGPPRTLPAPRRYYRVTRSGGLQAAVAAQVGMPAARREIFGGFR